MVKVKLPHYFFAGGAGGVESGWMTGFVWLGEADS
jgi:hypothetical protein